MTKEKFINILLGVPLTLLVLYVMVGNLATCASKKRIGAECCDGTISNATGEGACSNHDGVRRWRHTYWYSDMDEPFKTLVKS